MHNVASFLSALACIFGVIFLLFAAYVCVATVVTPPEVEDSTPRSKTIVGFTFLFFALVLAAGALGLLRMMWFHVAAMFG